MNPRHNGQLLISLATALFCAVLPARGQNLISDSATIKFHVRDAAGNSIPNAKLTVDHTWVVNTDMYGNAEIEYGPSSVFHIPVEVSARGFKKESQLVPIYAQSGTIYLEMAAEAPSASTGSTVSVSELPAAVRERSRKLEQHALGAFQRGDDDRALQLLREAVALTPSTAALYNDIGVVYMRRKDLRQAAEWFEKAAALSPYDPTILGNVGLIRFLQRRDPECYLLLDRAIEGGFSTPMAHYVLGVLALQQQQFAKAVNQLRKTDSTRYLYRDLYLSIGERGLGKTKIADRTFQNFMRNYKAPLAVDFSTPLRVTAANLVQDRPQ